MVLQLPIMGALTNDSHNPSESWLELIPYHKLQTSSKNVTKIQCAMSGKLGQEYGQSKFQTISAPKRIHLAH